MSTTATQSPTTRTEAIKVAEDVTVEELADLLRQNPGVTIFRPRCPRLHAYAASDVSIWRNTAGAKRVSFMYERNTRNGYGASGSLSVGPTTRRGDIDPVFDFYNIGRIVRVAEEG